MEIGFWTAGGNLIGGRRPLIPREGFVDVPEHTNRITVSTDPTVPQVWLLSVDGRREECAWDSGDWPVCPNGVRVLVVAEYSDGRILTRTFCPDHGQRWAEGLTLHVAVHDMRYREDVTSPAPSGARPIAPGALGHGQVVLYRGVPYRVVKATHRTDGSIRMKGCEQFSTGEGEPEWIELGKPNRLFVIG
jgi:hypothetical protein